MKKKLLLVVAVLSFTAMTAFLPITPPALENSRRAVIDLDDWLIDKATFDRMYDYYTNCRGRECRVFKKTKRNDQVREEIEKTYTIVNEDRFMGRYTDEDVPRYQKARGINANDGKGKVKGFSTIITRYEVVPKGGFLHSPLRFLYSDEYTICPPPDSPPCN